MSAQNRVAVTVFVEVDGDWVDPENVAVSIVERKLSGDPRGMHSPCPVEVVTATNETLSGTVVQVCDTGSAAASGLLAVRPSGKAFRSLR